MPRPGREYIRKAKGYTRGRNESTIIYFNNHWAKIISEIKLSIRKAQQLFEFTAEPMFPADIKTPNFASPWNTNVSADAPLLKGSFSSSVLCG